MRLVRDTDPTPIRTGILGLGRSGWDIHANALDRHPAYTVVAAADPVSERREEAEERFGCVTYADPASVIAADDIDLIIVATPSHTHLPLTLAAFEAGRHVVVEKPMAQSPEGVDEMIAAATSAGKVLSCYQQRRFDPDFRVIREIVSSGRLGELVLVRRLSHHFMRRADWQMLRKFDGGALSTIVPHLLDQLLQFSDPAASFDLLADLRHTVGAGDAEDHAKLTLRPSDGGPLLEVEASWTVAIEQPQWLVIGTAGAISGTPPDLILRWSDPVGWAPIAVDEGPAAGRRYGTQEVLEWTEEKLEAAVNSRPATLMFYDGLAAAIRTGAEPPITAASIRRQIAILQRARQQTGYL